MTPEVETNVAAEVPGKVVTAHVVGAAGKGAATVIGCVEPQILASDAGHHVSPEFFLDGRSVDRIEVIKNGPIGLGKDKTRRAAAIDGLLGPPRYFAAKTDVMPQNEYAAKAGVKAAA